VKPYIVHYQNKYPGGRVHSSESSLDVYCKDGLHRVALRKNGGSGALEDCSEEFGCVDRHDLDPLPKETRFRKLYKDGKIGNAEEFEERYPAACEAAQHECGGKGKVPSSSEVKAWNMKKEKEEKAARAALAKEKAEAAKLASPAPASQIVKEESFDSDDSDQG
jgi:hypothetical protein